FSLGGAGVLEAAYARAGFRDIEIRIVPAPLCLPSASEYVRFARESFGALHQMMAGLSDVERMETWQEIEQELRQFENANGFEGPCELVVGVGAK
ncbi:MAG: methyltransferase type 11, partial [Anaerolineae bacterium]|nr:methyltransferase type 11 [Anaerolineae bacterium]